MSGKIGRLRLSAGIAVLLLAAGSLTAADPKADLAIRNARVWTGDPNRPWAQAVAVAGGRILAVGANDDIGAWVGPSTRVVDGRGAALLPGLIDTHYHLLDLSTTGGEVPLNLRFVAGREELVAILASQAQEVPEGTWIFGEGWDERKWGGELPSKAWIDRVTPRHPVWLLNANGDSGLANSAALREAGIGRDTVEPPLEGIVRDRNGDPTGLMRGGPMWLMDRALAEKISGPAGNKAEVTMNRLAALGVTSVHHTGNWQELLIFQWLRKAGRLKTRIYAGVPLPAWVRMRDYAASHGRGDAWLHWGSLKLFKTTWTPGPAVDKAGRRDRWAVQPSADEVYGWFAGATQAGLQTMVHAGGYEVLKIYERISKELKPKDPRFRIEHAHDMPPEWIALYAAAGVIASVQPPLLAHIDDRTLAGVAPPRHLFPCRDLLDAGVRIVLGTDAVTASPLLSPFEVLAEAVERPGPDGRRLTLEQTLVAYTRDAAYAEFSEDMKGTLEPGKLADLILLDRDIFAAPITDLRQTQVRLTVVDGRIVHDLDRPAGRATSRGLSGPPPASP
ncbi:MAG: amidohydrolase [Candidatus Aminicenantales bacterium]